MESSKYDAIVVGSGIAGLMAATELNQQGKKVLVLEQNHQPGGLLAGIWRRGFYFDVGCQSLENMGILFPLLEQYGLSDLASFHRAHYRVKMPDIDTVVQTLSQTRQDFKQAYPHLSEGLDKVFDTHEKTSSFIEKLFIPETIPYVRKKNTTTFLKCLAGAMPYLGSLKSWMLEDFEDWYRRMLPPSGLTDLLATCGYTRMNLFIASSFWHLWAKDYWYPQGGFQKFFNAWTERLQSRGVDFSFKEFVHRFEKNGRKITAVITKKNATFLCRHVIYTGDYKQAVHELIGKEYYTKQELSKLDTTHHSDPLVSVYLGLNFEASKLKEILKTSHIFYFPNYGCKTAMDLNDPDAHQKTFLEITSHNIHDPTLAPAGKSSLVLQAFTRCEWLDHWKSMGSWCERSIEYKALKKKVIDDVVGVFEGIFPEVRNYIEYSDVGSPLSAYRFTRNFLGGSCGFELNWKNFPFLNPLAHAQTPFENLYMAGHFTVWPGSVPTAALSGKIAALQTERLYKKTPFRFITKHIENFW